MRVEYVTRTLSARASRSESCIAADTIRGGFACRAADDAATGRTIATTRARTESLVSSISCLSAVEVEVVALLAEALRRAEQTLQRLGVEQDVDPGGRIPRRLQLLRQGGQLV